MTCGSLRCLLFKDPIQKADENVTLKLTCFRDAWVQTLGLPGPLTITWGPFLQPILLGRAPYLLGLAAWGWGQGAIQRSPIPLCCLLGPLSLETHSRVCQSVEMRMEQSGSKSTVSPVTAFSERHNIADDSLYTNNSSRQFVIASMWQRRCLLKRFGARLQWREIKLQPHNN